MNHNISSRGTHQQPQSYLTTGRSYRGVNKQIIDDPHRIVGRALAGLRGAPRRAFLSSRRTEIAQILRTMEPSTNTFAAKPVNRLSVIHSRNIIVEFRDETHTVAISFAFTPTRVALYFWRLHTHRVTVRLECFPQAFSLLIVATVFFSLFFYRAA